MELETMTALELAKKIKQRQVTVSGRCQSRSLTRLRKKKATVHAYLDYI